MFRLAFRNIWNRRGANLLLFLELVAVTIIAWIILDPVVVRLDTLTKPLGYDRDRLAVLTIKRASQGSVRFNPDFADQQADSAAFISILDALRQDPRVESFTMAMDGRDFMLPDGGAMASTMMATPTDTLESLTLNFVPHTDFFTTFGIKTVPGSPSAEELQNMDADFNSDRVLTLSAAKHYFPDGVYDLQHRFDMDTAKGWRGWSILGIAQDLRMKSYLNKSETTIWRARYNGFRPFGNNVLVVRLKPGISPKSFASDPELEKFSAGNFYFYTAKPYLAFSEDTLYRQGITSKQTLGYLLCIFFLANLGLGVIGTFWLQTRSRAEEAGVMKSFGASRLRIRLQLLTEALALAFFSWAIGIAIYFYYAYHHGLSQADDSKIFPVAQGVSSWIDSFPQHFAVLSSIILLIILFVTAVGVLIPAHHISRIPASEALHAE